MSASTEVVELLGTCFDVEDHLALLVKSRKTGRVQQRIGSVPWMCSASTLRWLRQHNDATHDVYVSVNTFGKMSRRRSRADIASVRHLLLDVDHDAPSVRQKLERRSGFPQASLIVHTSPQREHVLWRVRDFDGESVQMLQRRLAADVGADPAATSVTQLTRLPGFRNHKYGEPYMVWVDYRNVERVYTPRDFPSVRFESIPSAPLVAKAVMHGARGAVERAAAYLSRVPPAVAGRHGDLHTFQICCRIVRGFALDDDQALAVLADWNARCQPPWTERELLEKIRSARRNGREPVGGML